jgi:riboflavin kinase/FMN adenylyltransferase
MKPRTLVAIGNFDGVHRGHCEVLRDAARLAREASLAATVLTFDPHPALVLGRQQHPVLTALERKKQLIERLDPSLHVHVEPFTPELAAFTPEQFVQRLLVDELNAERVIVGKNFRFGHRRSGGFEDLAALGERFGFVAGAQPLLCVADEVVSSSAIRQAVAAGDLTRAEQLLGRPHSLSGTVRAGQGRGRGLSAPTANLHDVPEVFPAFGVYACLVDEIAGEATVAQTTRLARGVINVGVRPTFGPSEPNAEVHLLDYQGDLYGRHLRVHLVERLRAEKQFQSPQDLIRQIASDVERARTRLASCAPQPDAGAAWY